MFIVSKTLFSFLTCFFYTVVILFVISGPYFTNGSHGSGVLKCFRCFMPKSECDGNNAGAPEPAAKDGYCYVETLESYATGIIRTFRGSALQPVNINYTVANSCRKIPGSPTYPEKEYNYTECRCNHEDLCNKGQIKPPPAPTTTTPAPEPTTSAPEPTTSAPEPTTLAPEPVKVVRARGSGSFKFVPQFWLIIAVVVMMFGDSFISRNISNEL